VGLISHGGAQKCSGFFGERKKETSNSGWAASPRRKGEKNNLFEKANGARRSLEGKSNDGCDTRTELQEE